MFLSYLCSRWPHQDCWACGSKHVSQGIVDHCILIEDPEFIFNLLEKADLGSSGARARPVKIGYVRLWLLHYCRYNSKLNRCGYTGRYYTPSFFFIGFENWTWYLLSQFIEGMLTNIGALPLDRIQTMLKFAPGCDRTIERLGRSWRLRGEKVLWLFAMGYGGWTNELSPASWNID